MFLRNTNHLAIILFTCTILFSCQLQEPSNNHGIVYLENRSGKLKIKNSNKNDAIQILGLPHSKSIDNKNIWIYVERTLSKGEYHKLGRNVLKSNNVLVLKFDKYGILQNKSLLSKNDLKDINFSKNKTENELTQKSFIENFLSSIRSKMYGKRD